VTAAEREELAREALRELADPSQVGELLSAVVEGDGVFTLRFAPSLLGYPGWVWTVSLAELPGESPTVLETELMPGDGALLAPDWVPWSQRLGEYRAAQAAAGEPDETAGLAEAGDDGEGGSEDLEDLDDLDDLDDDLGDDPDDGIDFESEDPSAGFALGEDEEDEPESEPDEDGPEPPAAAGLEEGREEEEHPAEGDQP